MADDDRLRDGELRRQLATLAYSPIRPATVADAAVAVGWWNLLARLGLPVPLVVVHDLGLVISGATLSGGREVRREGVPETPLAARYQALLTRMAQSETIAELAATPLRDDTLAVILARVLGDLYLRWHGRSRLSAVGDLPTSAPAYELDRAELVRGHDPAWVLGFMQRLCEQERTVLARLQQIDAGTLRLFGLFPVDGGGADLADLFRVVGTAGAADVVDFSLQLLPSLLETKRRPAAQRFSIDGYASVERRGESRRAAARGAGARRRGVRHQGAVGRPAVLRPRTPERGVAPAALPAGRRQRFDARRARGVRARAGAGAGQEAVAGRRQRRRHLAALLRQPTAPAHRSGPRRAAAICRACWASVPSAAETTRACFQDLALEVGRLVRDEGREVAITFITHGACQIPAATVKALAATARLYGIFVLPSGPLELDYLPHLHGSQVVSAESLARVADKRRRALEIVEDAASA